MRVCAGAVIRICVCRCSCAPLSVMSDTPMFNGETVPRRCHCYTGAVAMKIVRMPFDGRICDLITEMAGPVCQRPCGCGCRCERGVAHHKKSECCGHRTYYHRRDQQFIFNIRWWGNAPPGCLPRPGPIVVRSDLALFPYWWYFGVWVINRPSFVVVRVVLSCYVLHFVSCRDAVGGPFCSTDENRCFCCVVVGCM
jgi:hypothetical protein